jgi:hypothetical protein
LKHKRSEDAIKFIKEKKDSLIIAAVAAVAVVMGALSVNYLNVQKQAETQKAFGEAILSSASDRDALMENLREISQNHKGSVYATYSLMLLGQNLLEDGEYTEAAIILDEALKSKQPAPFLTVQILELKATALEFDGALDDALTTYDKALSVHNGAGFRKNDILLKSALLNLRMGQTDIAQKRFEEIVADSTASERTLRIAKNELSVLEF